MMEKQIILASKSPRRFELLKMLGVPFSVKTEEVDEHKIQERIYQKWSGDKANTALGALLVQKLAEAKAAAVWENFSQNEQAERIVVGADTVVMLQDRILGKPQDKADAQKMLYDLSGEKHQVYTGVTLISAEKQMTFYEKANVYFAPLDKIQKAIIEKYLMSNDALDKAGAYGIQGQAALLIDKIEGDYYTIMGLPIQRLYRELQKFEKF